MEIHGQHDERALLDPTAHRYLLDQFGGLLPEVREVTQFWERWRELDGKAKTLAQTLELAERERDYLTAACQELNQLAPQPGEEPLATRRAVVPTSGKVRADLEAASDALSPPVFPASKISGVLRRLERQPNLPENLRPILAALERVMIEADEARVAGGCAAPRGWRGQRRGHRGAAVQAPRHRAQAPRPRERASQRASALSGGPVQALRPARASWPPRGRKPPPPASAYAKAADALSEKRRAAASLLDRAVQSELKPLKLEKARFVTHTEALAEGKDGVSGGPSGRETIMFYVQTNPGSAPGALMKVASGGELARFLLGAESRAGRTEHRRPFWSSTKSTPASAARPPRPSASG